jgi:hypothetical protein
VEGSLLGMEVYGGSLSTVVLSNEEELGSIARHMIR